MTESDEGGEDGPRRRGRPTGAKGSFTFRLTSTLRSQIEVAASESGRTLSEEVETRLEQSFWIDEVKAQDRAQQKYEAEHFSPEAYIKRLKINCGGEEGFAFAMALGDHMRLVRKKHGIEPGQDITDLPDAQRLEIAKDFASALPSRFGLWDLAFGDSGQRAFDVLTGSGALKINPPKAEG